MATTWARYGRSWRGKWDGQSAVTASAEPTQNRGRPAVRVIGHYLNLNEAQRAGEDLVGSRFAVDSLARFAQPWRYEKDLPIPFLNP